MSQLAFFSEMSLEYPDVYNILRQEMSKYQDPWKRNLKRLLRGVPYFTNLDEDIIEELTYQLKMNYYSDGSQIFKQGDSVNKIHIVVEGKLDIILEINGEEIIFETLYQG